MKDKGPKGLDEHKQHSKYIKAILEVDLFKLKISKSGVEVNNGRRSEKTAMNPLNDKKYVFMLLLVIYL